MIRLFLNVIVEIIKKREVKHDFKKVCLTNLDSNWPMMIISVSWNVQPVIHKSGHVIWKAQAWLVELGRVQKHRGCVTAPLLRCAAEQSGGAVWSIRDENSLQCSHADKQGGRRTHSHIPYCKYNLIPLYSFSVWSTAVMCIPMPYLLPTFMYKKYLLWPR